MGPCYLWLPRPRSEPGRERVFVNARASGIQGGLTSDPSPSQLPALFWSVGRSQAQKLPEASPFALESRSPQTFSSRSGAPSDPPEVRPVQARALCAPLPACGFTSGLRQVAAGSVRAPSGFPRGDPRLNAPSLAAREPLSGRGARSLLRSALGAGSRPGKPCTERGNEASGRLDPGGLARVAGARRAQRRARRPGARTPEAGPWLPPSRARPACRRVRRAPTLTHFSELDLQVADGTRQGRWLLVRLPVLHGPVGGGHGSRRPESATPAPSRGLRSLLAG